MNENLEWKPQGDKIKTIWGEQLDPSNVLNEYPRPQLEREKWLNLNGLWEYCITDKDVEKPSSFESKKILVPFPIESSLSGVMQNLSEKQLLWYKKIIKIPEEWKNNKNILINFGAVDWKCDLFINDNLVGTHIGGYTSFSYNITKYLKKDEDNILILKVFDPTNKGYQPVGKQTLTPGFIWYTAVSGIWQTVWMEPVDSENYITKLKMIPDLDNNEIKFTILINDKDKKLPVEINLLDEKNEKNIIMIKGESNQEIKIKIPNEDMHLWSPDSPYLYSVNVKLYDNKDDDSKIKIDEVKSYTALRKISSEKDSKGIMRMKLNNKILFQIGPLDQGYFPDGLYTCPSEEAMVYDIKKIKNLGFNMIRKHVKVEPARYYYNCDKIGLLVWQDMVNGDVGPFYLFTWKGKEMNKGSDKNRSEESKQNYYKEWTDIIDFCISFPCVVVWTPFNEGWGQFDTEKIAEYTKNYDPSRLVNSASGGNHRICGDILDLHNYPEPKMFLKDENRINVMGEYGGLGLEIKGHTWVEKNWGYVMRNSIEDVTETYVKYCEDLKKLAQEGFSAAVYTQTTDCEFEINGLMTYDRKVMKVNEEKIKKANEDLINSLKDDN